MPVQGAEKARLMTERGEVAEEARMKKKQQQLGVVGEAPMMKWVERWLAENHRSEHLSTLGVGSWMKPCHGLLVASQSRWSGGNRVMWVDFQPEAM